MTRCTRCLCDTLLVNVKMYCFCSLSLELVLKVRIQNPSARENDFIEVELDRQELTYRSLLRVCCRELDISAEHVEKIRKLPNTMLRKVQTQKPAYSV